MKEYNIEISENILSLHLTSESLDFKISKDIKKDIEKIVIEKKEEIKLIRLYLQNMHFIDTSGVSFLVYLYHEVCKDIELIGCNKNTIDILSELKIKKLFDIK